MHLKEDAASSTALALTTHCSVCKTWCQELACHTSHKLLPYRTHQELSHALSYTRHPVPKGKNKIKCMVASAKTSQHGNITFRVSTGVAVLGILVHLLLAYDALSISVRGPSTRN